MRKDPVGYRFSPTGEELIIYYLMNKILGKIWLVDEAISEINICSYEPKFLPSLAKIKSDDPVWYFFCPIEYKSEKNKLTKRTAGSGFWKPTGKDRKIKDKRGKGVEIGLKKTLVYHQGQVGNADRTPWVIHEYHITCLPQNLKTNYVICQVMYNGEDGDILYGNKSNEPSHQSLASVSNTFRAINTAPEVQVEQPGEDNMLGMSVDDLVSPVNESLADGFNPNTLFNDNDNDNINPNVQPKTPCDEPYFNGMNFEDAFNTGLDQLEVEENYNGLSENDLLIPMNQHNDLATSAGYNSNTLLLGDYNNNNINQQPQTSDVNSYLYELFLNGGNFEAQGLTMQENRNEHRPKKALSGTFVDSSSDSGSDTESISAMSYKGTSSPGSSNVASSIPSCSSTDSCKDLQTSADPSISTKTKESQLISKQEVKQETPKAVDASMDNESSLVKTEKKGLFILEDAMERNRKNPRYIYFINMIIGFILLLALIANIISVY